MKKKPIKKLDIKKSTLINLSENAQARLKGGTDSMSRRSCLSECFCFTIESSCETNAIC
jgi:hypothetical protein